MAEYIDREKLIDYVKDVYSIRNKNNTYIWHRDIIDAIYSVPSTDVVSVEIYQQVKWERDTAIKQLKDDYGVGFCEKKNPDLIIMKHGKWIWDRNIADYEREYLCSCCGKRALYDYDGTQNLSKFCPCCGAKMDLGGRKNER